MACILAIPVAAGNPDYVQWVIDETIEPSIDACRDVLSECFLHGEQEEQASGAVGAPQSRIRSTPIGDYGFLVSREVSALVSPNGAVEWMCIPRFDSPSVFGRILGRHAGVFRIAPVDVTVPADVRYLPGTVILETSWGTPTGWIIVRDALLIEPGTIRPTGRGPTVGRLTTTRPSTSFSAPFAVPPAKCRPRWTVSRCWTTAAPT